MKTALVRVLVNAVALWVATVVVHGISLGTSGAKNKVLTLLVVAVIFGLVNAVIKPVVKLFTLPFYILTLGLLTFVVNALMLLLTSALAKGLDVPFRVHGFGSALLGALVVSLVSLVLSVLVPDKS